MKSSTFLALLWVLVGQTLSLSEPPLDCACQISGEMAFTAQHTKDRTGKWGTQIKVTRNGCNSAEAHTDIIPIPYPEAKQPEPSVPLLSLKELGYEHFDRYGHYKVFPYGDTWDAARRRCAADAAHLAIPNSDSEAAILHELIRRHGSFPKTKSNELAWLGLHDMDNEGFFLTIFGEPVSTAGWNQWGPQPDNAGGSGSAPGEDCVALHKNTGKMTDFNCNEVLAFVCEKEDGKYPPPDSMDYSAGAYKGVEMERKSPVGKVRRRRPSPGYELFPGVGFYKFHALTTTWDEARRICRAEGGHLAILNSAEEQQVLQNLFKRHQRLLRHASNKDFLHVGFHDQMSEGRYQTIFGEPLSSTGFYQWKSGYPNDNGMNIPGNDCGMMHFQGGLADGLCNWFLAYVCEQDLYL